MRAKNKLPFTLIRCRLEISFSICIALCRRRLQNYSKKIGNCFVSRSVSALLSLNLIWIFTMESTERKISKWLHLSIQIQLIIVNVFCLLGTCMHFFLPSFLWSALALNKWVFSTCVRFTMPHLIVIMTATLYFVFSFLIWRKDEENKLWMIRRVQESSMCYWQHRENENKIKSTSSHSMAD